MSGAAYGLFGFALALSGTVMATAFSRGDRHDISDAVAAFMVTVCAFAAAVALSAVARM